MRAPPLTAVPSRELRRDLVRLKSMSVSDYQTRPRAQAVDLFPRTGTRQAWCLHCGTFLAEIHSLAASRSEIRECHACGRRHYLRCAADGKVHVCVL